jgi:hypothetical protein
MPEVIRRMSAKDVQFERRSLFVPVLRVRVRNHRFLVSLTALAVSFAIGSGARANVDIVPVFDSSITSNAQASAIEGAIDSAISTFGSLYSNNLPISVDFSYNPAGAGNLLSTDQGVNFFTYSSYTAALEAASAAHPGNVVLAAAIAHLGQGNDAGGAKDMVITGALAAILGLGPASLSNASININSQQPFAFSRPVSDSEFYAIGGLEHELDEVLGGGGGGSWLNFIQQFCPNAGAACDLNGALDLYRYSAPGVPSFTTSGSASSYLSVDGGATEIVAFNQDSGGDYGDFSPPGAGAGQLIQNAFNSMGQTEAYTKSSPEFTMLESIGYNGTLVPEPSTWAMMLLGFAGLGYAGFRQTRKSPRFA